MSETADRRLRWGILLVIIAFALVLFYTSYRLNDVVEPSLDNIKLEVEVLSQDVLSKTPDKISLFAPAKYKVTWFAPQGAQCWYEVNGDRNPLLYGNLEMPINVVNTEFKESYGLACVTSKGEEVSKHIDVEVYLPYNAATDKKV